MSLPDKDVWTALKIILKGWIDECEVPGSVSAMPILVNRESLEKFIRDIDEIILGG